MTPILKKNIVLAWFIPVWHTDRAEGLLDHYGNIAHLTQFYRGEKKKKKSVSRGGEERPQQAETWTAADSYGLAQQKYKLEPVLQGLESVISEFYVLILHIFAHPWTYLQQPT